jgi:hypothetical protein
MYNRTYTRSDETDIDIVLTYQGCAIQGHILYAYSKGVKKKDGYDTHMAEVCKIGINLTLPGKEAQAETSTQWKLREFSVIYIF